MDPESKNWRFGEIARPKRASSCIVKGTLSQYEHFITNTRFLCIREATSDSHGILVKVLGKTTGESIQIKGGEPFVKDEKDEGFRGNIYYSFRFPAIKEVEQVLGIIRNNPELLEKFEEASMHINPQSTFWVRETTNKLLVMKEPQFYDARTGSINIQTDENAVHYRITLAYFQNSKVTF